MIGLRKALGDGKDGARYITTLPGRGYCFVAPISWLNDVNRAHADATASFSHANLPRRLGRMVGRDDDIVRLADRLTTARFVLDRGLGGVGKTTVAVAVGHHLMEAFGNAVLFVDLGMLSDPAWCRRRQLPCWGCRCDPTMRRAEPDRLSARQADPGDPRYLRRASGWRRG